MTHEPFYLYGAAPDLAILDILDAALDVAGQALTAANPGIESDAPYWTDAALGPAYEVEDRIADLQAAIGQYRGVITKRLPPDPELEEFEPEPPEPDAEQLQLPF